MKVRLADFPQLKLLAWGSCLAALQMSPDDGAKALAALSSIAPR